jgi:hypothetical protein
LLAAEAVAVHLQDVYMVSEAVQQGASQHVLAQNRTLIPLDVATSVLLASDHTG